MAVLLIWCVFTGYLNVSHPLLFIPTPRLQCVNINPAPSDTSYSKP